MMTTIEGEKMRDDDDETHAAGAGYLVLAERIKGMQTTLGSVQGEIGRLVEVVAQLARIEVQQSQFMSMTDRQASEIAELRRDTERKMEAMAKEMSDLKIAAPENAKSAWWIQIFIIALVAATLTYIAKETGLL